MMELPDEVENEENPEEKLESEEEIEFEWEELLGVNDDYEYPKTKIKAEEERESPLVSQETMAEKILKQVQDCNVDNKSLRIAEEVLGNLDEQGYLTIEPMLISDRIQVEEEEVLDVMHLIQRLDPPGLASVNMQDCLLAQAEVRNENNAAIEIAGSSVGDSSDSSVSSSVCIFRLSSSGSTDSVSSTAASSD